MLLLARSWIHSGYSVAQVMTLVSTGCNRTARTDDERPAPGSCCSFLHRVTSSGLKLSRATDVVLFAVSGSKAAMLSQWTCRCVA